MTWLLCDYGEVLCLPQPAGTLEALARLAGRDLPDLARAYWAPRAAYDRGDLDASSYWAEVLGEDPGDRLEALVAEDVGGWLHPNHDSLAAVERAAGRGLRLAILSNAPVEVADAIDALEWLEPFSPRVFSCRLGAVKPEPEAYDGALEHLGAAPGEVLFVDDRPANVEGARRAGLRAELFSGPDLFDRLG